MASAISTLRALRRSGARRVMTATPSRRSSVSSRTCRPTLAGIFAKGWDHRPDGRPARLRPDADPRPQPGRARSSSGSAAGWRPCGPGSTCSASSCSRRWSGWPGGITRDLLIGIPPATFRDWRYLAAAAAAGLVCFFARPALERIKRSVLVFDAVGLGLFCVTGATKALDFGVGPVPAILLGAITGIGGGILRDVLLRDVPTVLRHDLYAIPALLGAGVLVIAQESGSDSPVFPVLGAAVCVGVRLAGLQVRRQRPDRAKRAPLGDRRRARGRQREVVA